MGYAALPGRHSRVVILGLEPWMLDRGPLTRSAADHELMHGVQETHARALTRAWEAGERFGERVSAWGRLVFCEFHAGAVGSPLVMYVAISLVFLPLVSKIS
jgi:hypothetical protein